MKKIILFIATSLDGYVARTDGTIDWLFNDADYGYTPFLASVDTIWMGHKTYQQLLTFGDFPYKNKQNFVFTRNTHLKQDENVTFISEDLAMFAAKAKSEETDGNTWLVGGSEIITALIHFIDEYIIFAHPIILGDGIPLFPKGITSIPLKTVSTEVFPSGLIRMTLLKKAK
jgi:dihydrofolate reductase